MFHNMFFFVEIQIELYLARFLNEGAKSPPTKKLFPYEVIAKTIAFSPRSVIFCQSYGPACTIENNAINTKKRWDDFILFDCFVWTENKKNNWTNTFKKKKKKAKLVAKSEKSSSNIIRFHAQFILFKNNSKNRITATEKNV